MRQVTKGSINVSVDIYIVNATTGLPELGVLFNTAGLDLEYRRENSIVTNVAEVTLLTLVTAHTDGGFLEIGHGYYRFDVPDAAFASGSESVSIQGTATGLIVLPQTIQLVSSVWDDLKTAHTTAGSFGRSVADNEVFTVEVLLDTAEIGTAGAGLTNIDLPNQTMDITGNITGNISGSVGSVTAAVTVGTINSNVITAASIAASAMNGKGDWNINKTGYTLTVTPPTAIENRQEMDSNSADLNTLISGQTTINDNVLLIDTATMRGTDGANTVIPPTVAEFNARTIASADYFDPASDAVANVTLVDTTTDVTNQVTADITAISGNSTAADNLQLQYDTTGLTGDNFPATQLQVSTIAVGAGGLSTIQTGFVLTTGSVGSGLATDTEQLDGVVHDIDPDAGTTDFYYEFDLGTTNNVAVEFLWDGFAQGNGDSVQVFGFDWVSSTFKQIGSIVAANTTTIIQLSFTVTTFMTGTGANAGMVRCRFESTDASTIATDRLFCQFTSLAGQAAIFNSGVLQSATSNTAVLAVGASTTDDFYNNARLLISSGTGAGQERIIPNYDGGTLEATITPIWIIIPDNTSVYEIIPGINHAQTATPGYVGGRVFVDTLDGVAGTIKDVNGVARNPVDSLADAKTIATTVNLNALQVSSGSSDTMTDEFERFEIAGRGYQIDVGGQSCAFGRFNNGFFTGIIGGATGPLFRECSLFNLTMPTDTSSVGGVLGGTLTLSGAGKWSFNSVRQSFSSVPIIDFSTGANQSVNVLDYNGELVIDNLGNTGTDSIEISGRGRVTFNASCVGGTVIIFGNMEVVNNGSGMTFEEVARVDNTTINAEVDTGLTDYDAATGTELAAVDAKIDIIDTNVDSILVDTGTTIPASIAVVDANVDAILVDTSTTLPALIDDLAIKKNTAFSNFEFLMVLTSDGRTPATGLTVTGQRSIDGTSFAAVSGTITEVSNGIYQFDATSSDTNGDLITWRFASATADDTFVTFKTIT